MLPPSLTVNRNRLPLDEAERLLEPVHKVEVLHRLSRRSLDQVVQRRKDDGPATAAGESPADVAEVRVVDRAQLGEARAAQDAHERVARVAAPVLGLQLLGAHRMMELEVERREHPAVDRQEVRNEREVGEVPAQLLADLRSMAVIDRA